MSVACRSAVGPTSGTSDAALFGRAATVVRDRGHIADDRDFQADGLDGADGGLTTSAWAFHADFDLLEAMAHRLAAGVLGDHLRGVSGALAGALEAALAGARPADDRTA